MQKTPSPSEALTFVVRFWREASTTGEDKWHGRVEHIPSGEVRYVEDAAGVIRFLEQWMAPPDASGTQVSRR